MLLRLTCLTEDADDQTKDVSRQSVIAEGN